MWRPVIVASGAMALLVNAAWIGRLTMRHQTREAHAIQVIACVALSSPAILLAEPRVLMPTRVITTRVRGFSPMPVYTSLGRVLAPMPVVTVARESRPVRILVRPDGAPIAGALAQGSLMVVRPARESHRDVSIRFRDVAPATRDVTVPNMATGCSETIGRSRRFMQLIPRAVR